MQIKKTSTERLSQYFLPFFLILALQLLFSQSTLFFADEHENLLQGKYFSQIYTDIFLNHMPLSPLLIHVFYLIFGDKLDVEHLRIITAVINSLILFLIYLITSKLTKSKIYPFAGVALYILWEDTFWAKLFLTEHLSSLFGLLALFVLLKNLDKMKSNCKQQISVWAKVGFLLGVGTMSRLSIAYVAPLIFLTYYFFQFIERQFSITSFFSSLATYITGYLIPLAAFSLYFLINGNFTDFVNYGFLFNLRTHSGGINFEAFFPPLGSPAFIFLFLTLTFYVISSILVCLRKEVGAIKNYTLVLVYAVFAWLGCNPTGIGEVPFHAIPGLAGLAILNSASCSVLTRYLKGVSAERGLLKGVSKVVLIVVTCVFMAWNFSTNSSTLRAIRLWRHTKMDIPLYQNTISVAGELQRNTSASEYIYIIGHSPYIYYKADRMPASKHSLPVSKNPDEVKLELMANKPKLIYFPKAQDEFHFGVIVNDLRNQDFFDYIVREYRVSAFNPDILEPLSAGNKDRPVMVGSSAFDLNVWYISHIISEIPPDQFWQDYSNGTPRTYLEYTKDESWDEIHRSGKYIVEDYANSSIILGLACQDAKNPENLRILFDGEGGTKHENYWFAIFQLDKDKRYVEIPLDHFVLGRGNYQWDKITNIAVGSTGNKGQRCELGSLEFKQYTLRQ